MIELTEEERAAVENGQAIRLEAANLTEGVVVLRGDMYEMIREVLQEEQERRAIAEIAMANALGRELEEP
jgi:hypothetical protein